MARTDADETTFTAEERAAMKERAKELKSAKSKKADPRAELLAKIAELPEGDRGMAARIHDLNTETAPELAPRVWYGMPAYYKDGKNIVFFQPSSKFGVRYSTLGFETSAALDDGDMWSTAFAVQKLTPAVEARIVELVKTAVG